MSRKIEIDVVSDADAKGLLETAAAADHAADEVDKLGDQMEQTARKARRLDRDIAEQIVLLKALGREYEKTGDKAVLKEAATERATRNRLQQLRKDLADEAKTV